MYVCAKSLQSCPTLCNPMDCTLPGSSGVLQIRILDRLPCPPPGDLPNPGIKPTSFMSPAWQAGSLPLASTSKHPNSHDSFSVMPDHICWEKKKEENTS